MKLVDWYKRSACLAYIKNRNISYYQIYNFSSNIFAVLS